MEKLNCEIWDGPEGKIWDHVSDQTSSPAHDEADAQILSQVWGDTEALVGVMIANQVDRELSTITELSHEKD